MAKYKIIPSSRTIVRSPIPIGHKAEKGVEAIEFDLTAWVETYGSGTLTVTMRRWGDAIPYPVALELDENNKATWTLSDIDTAKAGMAYAQLNYIVGDEVVKKSDIYTFRVMDSLTGEGEPPEAYEAWLEHLTHLAAEAMAEVLDIEGIVTDKTLTVDGGIADAKKTGDEISSIKADLDELQDGGYVADQQKIQEKIDDWLLEHPEATTTVQDGSITEPKLALSLSNNLPRKNDKYRIINISSEKRALSVALIDKNNHAILFDLSDTDNAQGVINALSGVVNVDAVCISHYHYDHIGDYESIFAIVPHNGCVFYIPEAPSATFFESLNTVANNFITWINSQTGCSIYYPEENETVQINDVKITFNNADPTYWYDNYAVGDLNYNWLSITAYVEFGGIAMQITGDLYTDSEEYFFDTLHAGRKADIYQAPHHGLSSYYVSRSGITQVNPKIILANYGTDNEYLESRIYTSAITDIASILGIPVFDTTDNGTFEILATNGYMKYEHLKPFITTPCVDNYAYVRGLVIGGEPIEYNTDTHGIKDVLLAMPKNSSFIINAASSYKIVTDFGLSSDCIIQVQKFVGGSTNYLWDRTDTSQFYFNVDVYTREFGRNHFNFHGRYRDSDGFTVYDNSATKPVTLSFNAKKQNGTDAYLSLTKTSSISRGEGITVNNNSITVTRSGLYEMCLTPYSDSTSMDVTFANAPYYMRNGGSVIRSVYLQSGISYQILSDSNNTSSINGYIKLLAYSDGVTFPE